MLSIWPVKTAMIDRAHIILQKKEGDHYRGTKGCEACARGGSPWRLGARHRWASWAFPCAQSLLWHRSLFHLEQLHWL